MKRKASLFGILCLLMSHLWLSGAEISDHELQELSHDPYWHTLLHMRHNKSEIDDTAFFLSKSGKTDPLAELNATLSTWMQNLQNQDFLCRFPARILWLSEQLPRLGEPKDFTCHALDDLLGAYGATSVSLIFPTAHINSPASMYGHTFLRVDHDPKTPLLSQAINYAAKTNETNGLLYAFNGLLGGYEGRYSILPYYEKVKEYSDLEKRDIWEYRLNLSPHEIKRLLYHEYELKASYADYYFFTENCSYNLLWLLEAARPNSALTGQFHFKAIPVDTVRAVQNADFIEEATYRPSKQKKMEQIIKQKSHAKGEKLEVAKLDFEIETLGIEAQKKRIDKATYSGKLIEILKKRSRYPLQNEYTVKESTNPLLGHKSAKLSIGISDKGVREIMLKPAFHDKYDLEDGFISGAYIDFFALYLKNHPSKGVKFDKFDAVNIASYAPRDSYFKPLSWEVSFGLENDPHDKTRFFLKSGAGVSYGGEHFLTYLLLSPHFYLSHKPLLGLAPKVGAIYNAKKMKLGILGYVEHMSDGQNATQAEAFTSVKVSKDFALNLKYAIRNAKENDQETVTLSIFYYF